ncbi:MULTISPECIES: hypothetical protein [unclassified Xanthomonas]|uniref:hypothetical protein n=1 Tax=unclassified Xanthomonas TaxID=2643310 RepID=UPI000CEF07D7|nr:MULTISPECIES: hypothetical protein [unclassified Xanthomonas]PPU32183.1 hypothetical protein XspCFBP7912_13540 [Xanthomonas sp. CFBP 7912]RJS05833.1 hypothetical protein XnspCFBP7698_06635 [Xanthomonas sp. CFBP 7698]
MNFDIVREQTRLALPADDFYLYRLGVALYGFASITSFMIEIICRLVPNGSQDELSALETGKLCGKFEKALADANDRGIYTEEAGGMALRLIRSLNKDRSHFVHAYPITNGENAQILYRQPKHGQSFEVSNSFLDQFISRLHDASSKLYEIRNVLDRVR